MNHPIDQEELDRILSLLIPSLHEIELLAQATDCCNIDTPEIMCADNTGYLVNSDTCKTGAMKADSNKTQLGLISPVALEELGKVMTFGAGKYAPHNWEKGLAYSRVYDALQRHLNSWNNPYESDNDPETGLNHLAHAMACVSFLLHFVIVKDKYNVQHNLDDRSTPQKV